MGAVMRTGLTVLLVLAGLCAGRSRVRAGEEPASPIPIHPRVVTILQLPDEIVHTWLDHQGDIRIARIRDKLYIRPRPGTPAGVEASLEVKTRTLHQTFQLRVVARARDANRNIRVLPVDVHAPEDSPPEVPAELAAPFALPAGPVAPPPAVTPEAEAMTNAFTDAASSASPEPIAVPEPAEPSAERKAAVSGVLRFDLSAYLIMGLGVTALDFVGYVPHTGFQPNYALGIRVAGEPPGGQWALEVELSAESLAGPLVYFEQRRDDRDPDLVVDGLWLNAMLGARFQRGIRWRPSVYTGIGAQAHLRETLRSPWLEGAPTSTLEYGGVLALGMGLQRRTRHISLGFDVQVRLGGLDEYRSLTALLTLGRVLDEENAP